ncbi:GNAT family N-acetyltransferase [Streptomyces sp. NPDC006385]|uniref:GNAT family N-acetyltransferase n=1 Tax=Streptomyces sp. NPDC006385 TaxID=3156761 RepID=UPI0033BC6649
MTTPGLTIAAAAADHPSVRRLVRALDDDLAARYPDEPCTGGSHLHPAIRFLLAEADGRPVGCCAVQPFPAPDTAAELKRMYVAPEARGRGIAARLLAGQNAPPPRSVTSRCVWRRPSTSPKPSRCTPAPTTSGSPTTRRTNTRRSAAATPNPSRPPGPPCRCGTGELATFLAGQGLSSEGVLAPGTRYWLTRDTAGPAAALGWERQDDHVLLRSVAVRPDLRGCGGAQRLVEHALVDAAAQGARTAYLFSTEAGPFWTRLGFRPIPVAEVARALPHAPQVHQYSTAGTLADEAAWRRDLHAPALVHLDRHAPTPADGR